tara:strand:- start:829 stop:1047 length:219 start_codon:yes stop_codon:yes gene_type:complete
MKEPDFGKLIWNCFTNVDTTKTPQEIDDQIVTNLNKAASDANSKTLEVVTEAISEVKHILEKLSPPINIGEC